MNIDFNYEYRCNHGLHETIEYDGLFYVCRVNLTDDHGLGFEHSYSVQTDPKNDRSILPTLKNPLYINNGWNFNIENVTLDWLTGYPIFEISSEMIYYTTTSSSMNRESSQFEIKYEINSKESGTISSNKTMSSFDKQEDKKVIPIDLTKEDLSIDYEIMVSNTLNISDGIIYDEGNIFIPKVRNNVYNVDLVNNEKQTIVLPIDSSGNFEIFTFNSVNNEFKFPTTIDSLYAIKYQNELGNQTADLSIKQNADIEGLKGVENTQVVEIKDENVKFSNSYYYDKYQKKTIKGHNNDFQNYDSLILPWDYENNYGVVTTEISAISYSDLTFKVKLKIGNSNSLRGTKKSKYYWDLSNDINNNHKYTLLIDDISQEYISRNDIKKWIK